MRLLSDRLRLELQRARRPLIILVTLGLAALVCGGVISRNLTFKQPWKSYRDYRVTFQDTKGVVSGQNEVRISGVKVGVVQKVELRDGRPVVTLIVEKKYGKLYRDARLRLRPVTPLQDMFISVDSRGTPGAGELERSDVLPVTRTESPVDISRVLNVFDADARARMRTLIDGVARGLGDRGPQLKAAFATLGPFLEAAQGVSGALEERRGDVRRLVRDLAQVSDELGDRDRTLVSMIRRGNTTLGELARRDEPIGRTLAQLPGTLATLQSSFAALRATQDELDPALRSLQPVADRLPEGLEGLRRLSDDLGPAATALRGPVHQLRPLTRALSPTVRSLDAAIGALSPQAPRLDLITRTTVPCLDDVQAFFQRTSSLFKFGDAYQVTPRADVVINYQTPALKPIQGPLPGETGPIKRPRKCFNRGRTP